MKKKYIRSWPKSVQFDQLVNTVDAYEIRYQVGKGLDIIEYCFFARYVDHKTKTYLVIFCQTKSIFVYTHFPFFHC